MIREFHLADWFTLANAVCGTGALFSMMTFLQTSDVLHVYFACALVVAAMVFDVLDGRARFAVEQRFGLHDGRKKSYREVGEELGVTAEAARRMVKRAVNAVRTEAASRIDAA